MPAHPSKPHKILSKYCVSTRSVLYVYVKTNRVVSTALVLSKYCDSTC